MALILPRRRGLLLGLAGLVAAPALVRAESLMRVSSALVPAEAEPLSQEEICRILREVYLRAVEAMAEEIIAEEERLLLHGAGAGPGGLLGPEPLRLCG